MNIGPQREKIVSFIDGISDDIIALAQDLIRIPSSNHPPTGEEEKCQEFVFSYLTRLGLKPDSYLPTEVEGIQEHPAWWPGREYTNRPNITARRTGQGKGKSLLLSGHVDTVPLGSSAWSVDPFGAVIRDGNLFGLGSFDMKAGVAALLSATRVIVELDIPLAGDLLVETVVDEEFAGANGTLAGRLRGYLADGMIVPEPSGLSIWNGNCGGRFLHLHFSTAGGIALGEEIQITVVDQINAFLTHLERFRAMRRSKIPDRSDLAHDPVPVWVTKVALGGWGPHVPITVPAEGQLELYWQLLPGETVEEIDEEFNTWLAQLLISYPKIFRAAPQVSVPYRFMPASIVPDDHPFVLTLRHLMQRETGRAPIVELGRGPSDIFVVNHYFKPCPAIMFGPRGGNAHEADENVIAEDLATLTKTLVLFAVEWCGLAA